MKQQTITVFGYKTTAATAQKALRLHYEAFRDSACRKCPGSCCFECAKSDGYLDPKKGLVELKAKYGWTADKGFAGDHGCKLPVTKRSTTCISFYCNGTHDFSNRIPNKPKKTPIDDKKLKGLLDTLRFIVYGE